MVLFCDTIGIGLWFSSLFGRGHGDLVFVCHVIAQLTQCYCCNVVVIVVLLMFVVWCYVGWW
jgi:hypothetical protein